MSRPSVPSAPPSDGTDDLIGRTLVDRYRITERLARGGMGSVFLGVDEQTGDEVAIKVVRGELAQSEEALARFHREVRAVITLDSPHIVRAHDAGTVDGMPYLVMERLRGRGLDELQQDEEISARRAVSIVLDLLEGLADAHAAGVIHRDLKPSNVWIAEGDGVKILDFGVAKMHGVSAPADEETGKLTGSGAVLGSPAYMSPEQLVSSKEADERADVWSVGVVLYELLTGTMLFKAETVGGIFANVIRMRIPPLGEVVPGICPELERIVARCLERDPSERYSSAGVLAEKLRPLLEADARGESPLMDAGGRRSIRPVGHGSDIDESALGESPTVALSEGPATLGRPRGERSSHRWLGAVMLLTVVVVAVIAFVGARASSKPSALTPASETTATAGRAEDEAATPAPTAPVTETIATAEAAASATASLPEAPPSPRPAAPPTPAPPPSSSTDAPPEDDLWETSRH